jgi:prepilin-type N-terminal cleavage/methylation domain-containing protein
MRLGTSLKTQGFTLAEMLIAMAISVAIIAVTVTTSVALQKSFYWVDNYFGTHMQQIRIVDYLARDVRRGLSVVSSVDKHTVTVNIPRYIIQAGDADATGLNIGTPRAPSLAVSNGDYNVNYLPTSTSPNSVVVYTISGSSILRTEDNVITTIASSTDSLLPETVDIELANTEYTTTAITFQPMSVADRTGTVVYSTAYLRNRRRPTPTPSPTP